MSALAGTAYGVLLFATGAGGVIGGIVLEAAGWIRPTVNAGHPPSRSEQALVICDARG